jgi:hypothetical protein
LRHCRDSKWRRFGIQNGVIVGNQNGVIEEIQNEIIYRKLLKITA